MTRRVEGNEDESSVLRCASEAKGIDLVGLVEEEAKPILQVCMFTGGGHRRNGLNW